MAMDNAIREHKPTPAGVYERLNRRTAEIRLIQILPDDQTGRVECSIKSYDLGEAPGYTALSYTWGRPDPDCFITVNSRTFPVRKNLFRFLRQAASSPRHNCKLFWIDALCIDQHDQDERTHQVGLMSMIYRRADYVLVWLGPAYDSGDEALRAFRRHNASVLAKVWWTFQGAIIRLLCQRAYWTRLWVLQELALARRVRLACGKEEVSWECFMSFMEHAKGVEPIQRNDSDYEYLSTMTSPAALMLKHIRVLDQTPTLYEQMRASRHLKCTDQRDKIFALLGIVQSTNQDIVADYTMDMSTLLNMVLRDQNQHRTPGSLDEVRERCTELAQCMELSLDAILAHPLGKSCELEHITGLEWANHYHHHEIEDLWYKERDALQVQRWFLQAAEEGATRTFSVLLHGGRVDLDCCIADGSTALHLAIAKRYYEGVRALVQHQRIDVNKRNTAGRTALHTAVLYDSYEGVRTLLQHQRIDVNMRLANGSTALHLAAAKGHYENVCALLQHQKIDVNKQDTDGSTALHLAAAKGHDEIVCALLQHHGVDINERDNMGQMPLWCAVTAGHTKVVSALLAVKDIDYTRSDENHSSLLHKAAEEGNDAIFHLLLHLPEFDLHGDHYWMSLPPLTRAALSGSLETVRALLESPGTDINFGGTETSFWPALTAAASSGNEEIVWELLSLDTSDVNIVDHMGMTALSLAAEKGHTGVARMLLDQRQIAVNQTSRGNTPLHRAAARGHLQIVESLLQHRDIQVNGRDDDSGATALHMAAAVGHTAVVQAILEHRDINVNLKEGCFGFTPLMYAIISESREVMVETLLQRNDIDVNAKDKDGNQALDIAERGYHNGVVRLLLQDGIAKRS